MPTTSARRHPGRPTVLVGLAGLLLTVSGCTSLQGTGDKGFVTGAGINTAIPVAKRGDPVSFEGKDLDGTSLSLASMRGRPTVVTVWWSACGPCRKEAPLLVDAAHELGGRAHFVGIDVRDPGRAAPQAFESAFHVPWPSYYSPGGEAVLAFPGTLNPNTIPATVVLDSQGRVAASIIGGVPTTTTLVDLVDDVVHDG